jgi:capsular polysaccharide biosynthesis protein
LPYRPKTRARRARILVVAVLTVVAAPLICWIARPSDTFQSQATLEIGGDLASSLIDAPGSYQDAGRQTATELQILTSLSVLTDAKDILASQKQSLTTTELLSRITVESQPGSNFIRVSATGDTGRGAENITAALVTSYLTFRGELRNSQLEVLQKSLSHRIAVSEAKLLSADESQDADAADNEAALRREIAQARRLLAKVEVAKDIGIRPAAILSGASPATRQSAELPWTALVPLSIVCALGGAVVRVMAGASALEHARPGGQPSNENPAEP